jgi:hypothetical protein
VSTAVYEAASARLIEVRNWIRELREEERTLVRRINLFHDSTLHRPTSEPNLTVPVSEETVA